MTALLIKESVNQTVDNMGFKNAMTACFSLHQINHAHWAEIHGDGRATGLPEDGVPSWRDAPPVVLAESRPCARRSERGALTGTAAWGEWTFTSTVTRVWAIPRRTQTPAIDTLGTDGGSTRATAKTSSAGGVLREDAIVSDNYKWLALINTTLGVLMATIDGSIVLIAMPDIFRGIKLDPLAPGNSFYLLWMILGFLVVTSVLVVSFGRLGDMYGRVKMYNFGFAMFTFFSLLLTITWMTGTPGPSG